jgi:hypothetical protein
VGNSIEYLDAIRRINRKLRAIPRENDSASAVFEL